MSKIELGFDSQVVRGLVDREDWEPDEPGRERRAVGLGSVMSLTPSGKCYMPFACGNLNPCPCCNGTGNRGEPTCERCGGTGSHEAWDDEKWYEAAEAALAAVGLGLETSEGDGTYLLAVEYRDASDAEDVA